MAKCFLCKSSGQMKTLSFNQLKCIKHGFPDCTKDDTFCGTCYIRIQHLVKKTKEKQKQKKLALQVSQVSSNNTSTDNTNSNSGTLSSSISRDEVDEIVAKTPQYPENKRRALAVRKEVGGSTLRPKPVRQQVGAADSSSDVMDYLTSQGSGPMDYLASQSCHQVAIIESPLEISDDDDNDGETNVSGIAGPSSSAIVQPIIRRRREEPVFNDERIVPIYNRTGLFGG